VQTATDKLYCTQGGRPILGRRCVSPCREIFRSPKQAVEGWLIFIDLGEASDWLFEDVVRQIIIDRRYFADQDVLFLGDEAMPNARQERDTFARRKSQFPTGGQTPWETVRLDNHLGFTIDTAVLVGHEQLEHELPAPAVDDILRLDIVAVHRAQLIAPRDHYFLGIELATARREIVGVAVSECKQEKSQ